MLLLLAVLLRLMTTVGSMPPHFAPSKVSPPSASLVKFASDNPAASHRLGSRRCRLFAKPSYIRPYILSKPYIAAIALIAAGARIYWAWGLLSGATPKD